MPDRTLPSLNTQVIKIDDLSVRISASAAELTQDIVMLAQEYLQSLLKQQATVRIILATGNSQLDFLLAIAQEHQLDWSRIIFFHLDEYVGIAGDHPGSFR